MTDEEHLKRYFYTYNGAAVVYDIYARSLKDARASLRRRLNVKRLPKNYQIWSV
jgi:hypothetical protein